MADEAPASEPKTKVRSPAYPGINLEEAIEKATLLYNEEDGRFANVEAVAEHWSMPGTSSGFQVSLAALKHFGLLVDEGSKENRRVKLTERALDIVVHEEGSPKRTAAIREAALAPRIHTELWEKYGGKLPPSDASIRVYLLRERAEGKFNKNYVDAFITQLRATVAFANLATADKILPADGVDEGNPPAPPPAERKTPMGALDIQSPPYQPSSGMRELPVTLPSSLSVAVFRVPYRMNEIDFNTLVNSLTAMKAALVTAEVPEPDKR